jgi:hypothetical protein
MNNLLKIILFCIFSVIILIPVFKDSNLIDQNDLNGNITPLLLFKDSLLKEGSFSQWNQYVNQGIPQTADPLFGVFNPVISLPIILLPYQYALKLIYLLSGIIAASSMYLLLKYFKITEKISILISLTYLSSGYFASRIVAGHLEKVVSFAFLPLLLFSLIKTVKEKNILWSGITGIVLSLILLSGDIYNALFCIYTILIIAAYYFLSNKKITFYLVLSIILFVLFSSIKIIPMVELQPYIAKIKDPFSGSQNFISIFYYLFLPYDFVDKLVPTSKFLSNAFGWWENISFIGPLSVIGFFSILKTINKKNETVILAILFVLYILMSMPALAINPLHILISNFSTLQFFHVPSRIFALLSIIILVSLGLFLNRFSKNKKLIYLILFINLFLTTIFSQNILINKTFAEIEKSYIKALDYISKKNPNNYYALHLTSSGDIPQDIAYQKKMFFLQSNYGLLIKDSPVDVFSYNKKEGKRITPGFILSENTTKSIDGYEISKTFYDKNINLFTKKEATPFASIDNISYKPIISNDKIIIFANAAENKNLILIQNNYPGWNAYIDGKKTNLLKDGLLTVRTIKGNHKYEFIFSSQSFYFGTLISIVSISLWGFYLYLIRMKIK